MTSKKRSPSGSLPCWGYPLSAFGQANRRRPRPESEKKPALVHEVYPGLASSSLTYARLSDLPPGVILKTEGLTLSPKEVADEIAQAPAGDACPA